MVTRVTISDKDAAGFEEQNQKNTQKIGLLKEGRKQDRDFRAGLILGITYQDSTMESGREDRHINAEYVHSWGSKDLARLADFLNRFFSAINAYAWIFIDTKKGSSDQSKQSSPAQLPTFTNPR